MTTSTKPRELRLPAIEVTQGEGRTLYTFAVDGKLLPSFATVSRIRRDPGVGLEGYQRPEVQSHIQGIRQYLESERPLIPNAVVIAFDPRVRFEPGPVKPLVDHARQGTLVIPFDPHGPETERPGFVVDGQQRLAAIRDAAIDSFPICVTAFVTDDVRQQVEQFLLVNSTKPLPKGLIYELLPSTDALLPPMFQKRRFPALLTERLNYDDDSPFRHVVQTATNPKGLVKDNSLIRMLENSLDSGILFRLRGAADPEAATEAMLEVVKDYWVAVSNVFPQAWNLPAKRSRLMHGAGIVSMGLLMDIIGARLQEQSAPPSYDQFVQDLTPLRDACRWTDGIWDFGPGNQRKWSTLQNTSADIKTLSGYLYHQYRSRVWDAAPPPKLPTRQEH